LGAPQLPSQPYPAEPARTLDAHSIEPDRYALLFGRGCFKQLPLLVCARNLLRQQPGVRAAGGIQFPQLRDGFLHHLAAASHRAHQLRGVCRDRFHSDYRRPHDATGWSQRSAHGAFNIFGVERFSGGERRLNSLARCSSGSLYIRQRRPSHLPRFKRYAIYSPHGLSSIMLRGIAGFPTGAPT
jgi:hypothetical protein